MKCTKDFERLGLPEEFKFGIELEADNVKTRGKNGLYVGESAKYIKSKKWHMATELEEALVSQGGAELVSPILTDSEQDWQNITDICNHMKKYPGLKGKEVVTNSKCGLHVHFDSECLTKNPKRMQNFLRLYAESEELLYKMCNDKDNPIREKAINKFHSLALSTMFNKGVAAPTGNKILKQIENGTLKVSYKKYGILKMAINKLKIDARRYNGLNLTNIGNNKKNTIEFRMANGTLDPEVIKQNVFLYSSLINTAIKMTEKPEMYEEKLNQYYDTELNEEEKAKNFLNLIMENPEDKKIYMDRWKSVKDAQVFANNSKKQFAQERFKRNEFKKIADRTPGYLIKQTYMNIKGMLDKTKKKGDMSYGRESI